MKGASKASPETMVLLRTEYRLDGTLVWEVWRSTAESDKVLIWRQTVLPGGTRREYRERSAQIARYQQDQESVALREFMRLRQATYDVGYRE